MSDVGWARRKPRRSHRLPSYRRSLPQAPSGGHRGCHVAWRIFLAAVGDRATLSSSSSSGRKSYVKRLGYASAGLYDPLKTLEKVRPHLFPGLTRSESSPFNDRSMHNDRPRSANEDACPTPISRLLVRRSSIFHAERAPARAKHPTAMATSLPAEETFSRGR